MAAFILVNCNISFSSDNNNISDTQHSNKNKIKHNKVDVNEIRKALYNNNDPDIDQSLKKKIDKVKSSRDVYLAPEVDYGICYC